MQSGREAGSRSAQVPAGVQTRAPLPRRGTLVRGSSRGRGLPPPARVADGATKGRAVARRPLRTREIKTRTPGGEAGEPPSPFVDRTLLRVFARLERPARLFPQRRGARDRQPDAATTRGVGAVVAPPPPKGPARVKACSGASSGQERRSRRGRGRRAIPPRKEAGVRALLCNFNKMLETNLSES